MGLWPPLISQFLQSISFAALPTIGWKFLACCTSFQWCHSTLQDTCLIWHHIFCAESDLVRFYKELSHVCNPSDCKLNGATSGFTFSTPYSTLKQKASWSKHKPGNIKGAIMLPGLCRYLTAWEWDLVSDFHHFSSGKQECVCETELPLWHTQDCPRESQHIVFKCCGFVQW